MTSALGGPVGGSRADSHYYIFNLCEGFDDFCHFPDGRRLIADEACEII